VWEDTLSKAIALRGKGRIGKSQTIRTVDELLRNRYSSAIVEHEYRTRVELRAVLNINGVKIGIESTGENIKRINESFDLFLRLGCEVIICATRTTGNTVTAVNSLPGYEVVWFEQQAQSDPIERVFGNLAMARRIVEETEKAIASAKPAALRHAAGR
jgi:hypothetical protein